MTLGYLRLDRTSQEATPSRIRKHHVHMSEMAHHGMPSTYPDLESEKRLDKHCPVALTRGALGPANRSPIRDHLASNAQLKLRPCSTFTKRPQMERFGNRAFSRPDFDEEVYASHAVVLACSPSFGAANSIAGFLTRSRIT